MSNGATPSITTILLAGGASSRYGSANKLVADLDGVPLLVRTIRTARAAGAARVLVVTGHDRSVIEAVARSEGVDTAYCADHALGMGCSIAAGVRCAQAADGWLVWPGDMPFVETVTAALLLAAFDPERPVVPIRAGRRGHPVLFPRIFGARLHNLVGEAGARGLLDGAIELETGDPGISRDVDVPEDLAAGAFPS